MIVDRDPPCQSKGRQEGIEHGSLQSSRNLLFQTLEIRFGQISEELRTSVNACISTDRLSDFHRQALLTKSIKEVMCFAAVPDRSNEL